MAQIDINIKWFLSGIIIILLIIVGYLGFKVYNQPIEEFPKETNIYCTQNVIPENLIFGTSKSELDKGEHRTYDKIESRWKDGTPIRTFPRVEQDWDYEIKCTESGNYLYCKDLYYSKTPINKDYSFGKTRIILVDLVLDKTKVKISHFQPADWNLNYHWVIEYPVVNGSCRE